MSEWKTQKFSDIADSIQGGGTPSTKEVSYWNGDIAWLTPAEITNHDGIYISDTQRHITNEGIANSSAKIFEPNTVLMTSRATIGTAVLNQVPMATNQGFINIKPKEEEVKPEFLYFWINANRRFLESQGTGSTFREISKGTFKNLEITYPNLKTQKNITIVLSNLVRKVTALKRKRDIYLQLKQSLIKELFDRINDSECDLMKLGDIAKINTGTTPSTSKSEYYTNGTIPFIKTGEINNNLIYTGGTLITENAVKESSLKTYPINTVFMAMYGQGNTRGRVSLLKIEATTSQNTAAIVPNKEIYPEYLWNYLLGQYEKLRALGVAGHISHLNLSSVKNIVIPVPPYPIQQDIANKIVILERKIELTDSKLGVFQSIFDSLLNKLMNQEIDVSNLEIPNA